MAIQIKSLDELKIMRQAGLLVAHTLDLMRESIKVGMRTDALDAIAAANIKRGGATSNFDGECEAWSYLWSVAGLTKI